MLVFDWESGITDEDIRRMKMSKVTMTKRYYMGSESVVDSDFLGTLSEATEKAKAAVERGDEVRYVVEVVRIVRRANQPVIVEEVRK